MSSIKGNVGIFVIAVFLVVLSGCSVTQPNTSNVTDLDNVDFSENLKMETSCANYILGFIGPFGDHSVPATAESAGIAKVQFVDYEFRNYVLISQTCANVYGQ